MHVANLVPRTETMLSLRLHVFPPFVARTTDEEEEEEEEEEAFDPCASCLFDPG